jgi:hypothetical protein
MKVSDQEAAEFFGLTVDQLLIEEAQPSEELAAAALLAHERRGLVYVDVTPEPGGAMFRFVLDVEGYVDEIRVLGPSYNKENNSGN